MNVPFVLAAVLAAALGIAHSVLGERFILQRLFRRDLPKLFGGTAMMKATLRFAWHLTTIAWLGAAAILVQLALGPLDATGFRIAVALLITFLASGLLALVATRGRHFSWAVFLAIAVAIVAGMRAGQARSNTTNTSEVAAGRGSTPGRASTLTR